MISGGGRASAAGVCASNEAPKELSLPSLKRIEQRRDGAVSSR